MAGHDVVTIGASAGGLEPLREIVSILPADLPASLHVVMHLASGEPSMLPEILGRSGPLPAVRPADGQAIRHGVIYVAQPDRHVLIDDHKVRVVHGPRHNRMRPAVDPLFRSAARAHGNRVVGVILSGALDDGTAGLGAIKAAGGTALVQDPETAQFDGMPRSAIERVPVDQVLAPKELARAIEALARQNVAKTEVPKSARLDEEFKKYMGDRSDMDLIGKSSVFTCPECQGTLWEVDEGGVLQYHCRVGHSFSTEGLLAEHDESMEASLWAALRALEENSQLKRRIADRFRVQGQNRMTRRLDAEIERDESHAANLRKLLERPLEAVEKENGR